MEFKNMYDPAILQEFKTRINSLTPASQRQWGKMDVAQMMAHCCKPLEVALGDMQMHPNFIMKLLAPMFKSAVVGPKPFGKSSPTAPEFKITDQRDFDKEKTHLLDLLTRFSKAGPEGMGKRLHPFFGKLTPEEWSDSQYKHLDHHLKQFSA